jgi:hypothetical protein
LIFVIEELYNRDIRSSVANSLHHDRRNPRQAF